MLFSVDELIEYVARRVTMFAGDVLFTGTTAGVGLEDGRFLRPGDVVEAAADGIGVLRNRVGQKPV
jgi:2-keto-4-pentenoate hydratase/2-oxohepta-3-ene-1,7-dioic acid hydratase in catechol pathway